MIVDGFENFKCRETKKKKCFSTARFKFKQISFVWIPSSSSCVPESLHIIYIYVVSRRNKIVIYLFIYLLLSFVSFVPMNLVSLAARRIVLRADARVSSYSLRITACVLYCVQSSVLGKYSNIDRRGFCYLFIFYILRFRNTQHARGCTKRNKKPCFASHWRVWIKKRKKKIDYTVINNALIANGGDLTPRTRSLKPVMCL